MKKTNQQQPRAMILLLALSCLALSTLTCLPQVTAAVAGQNRLILPEYQLKAVYLYNFLNFVHWPKEQCGLEQANPREIAVVGISPFGDALLALQAKLKKAGKPPLSIIIFGPYKDGMDLRGCRLLFISDTEEVNMNKIIASIAGEPILTVSDNERLLETGVMITLVSRKNKVRWAINRVFARQAGLRMNAKLLDIAVKVID